jgi:hypothetical protein
MDYKYEIGGRKYFQKPLVMGQFRQLSQELKDVRLPDNWDIGTIMTTFADKLHVLLAIVLIPEGIHPKDKVIEELSKEIEFEVEPDMVFKVAEDFFGCNDIPLLLQKMVNLMAQVTGKVEQETEKMKDETTEQMKTL